MYTTDCVNQIVCFIYDDYIAVKPYSTGFSGGLVEKDVIGQNDKLVEDKIGKKIRFPDHEGNGTLLKTITCFPPVQIIFNS